MICPGKSAHVYLYFTVDSDGFVTSLQISSVGFFRQLPFMGRSCPIISYHLYNLYMRGEPSNEVTLLYSDSLSLSSMPTITHRVISRHHK
jgi:hypothetical protein